MSPAPQPRYFWIIGPGRLGLALGSELLAAGIASRLSFIGRSGHPPENPLFLKDVVDFTPSGQLPDSLPAAILLTTPDDAIRSASERVEDAVGSEIPVLHTSGVLGSEVLKLLAARGASTGSIHPLVSIADPVRDAPKLRGAWFGVEGATAARSVAGSIVAALGGRTIELNAGGKPLYHAAAVLGSNYAVTLLAVAERLMREAGVEASSAREALTTLAAGAVQNVAGMGPVDALTGPISRGDDRTVGLHLGRLSPEDLPLYSVLARETLLLAQARGLAPEAAERIQNLLRDSLS